MVWFLDSKRETQFFDESKQHSYQETEIIGLGVMYSLTTDNKTFFLNKQVYKELMIRYPESN